MSTVTIGTGDEGRDVNLIAGDTVVLKLPENPTTGMRWQPFQLPSSLRLIRDTYDQSSDAGIGAASTRVLEFGADVAGRFGLRLRRMREWEGESSIEAKYSVTLVVKAGA